ncbi:patatin-like phospholipase family protein [Sulfurimonas paralvinellae]|uniref:Serine protease n=1 Tax=Sulfurimonas paralvinellae TaxID=317658 RepID=A0A7M1B6U2_9BACT|nr:patatin-like phospholipase family protein [Sulfurimonas paralvinellae]QOP45226.1 serine protease [Sulfurimonas paralvinellae]
MKEKTISLVLGSGGARGITHIGIIKWLEENGYEIKSISGCSMGALVGGFYAAGKLDAYAQWLENIDVLDMLKLLDFKGSGGFVSGTRLMQKLQELIGEHNIESLPIKFTAVATDIDTQKEVWINEGPLLDAIRASISLPLFFTPFTYKGKRVVDGGVLNPVPIAPTFHDATDLTISVNLGGEAMQKPLLEKEEKSQKSFKNIIDNYLNRISLPDSFIKENGMYAVANRSFETMQSSIARMKLAAYPSDVEIDIPINLCGTFEFNRAKELIEYGYNICETIDELKEHNGKSI